MRRCVRAAPRTGPPISRKHQESDRDLYQAEQSLEHHVPYGSGRAEHTDQPENRGGNSQSATDQERDQDQPERPAPAPENTDG
jgi:hypothetical protein